MAGIDERDAKLILRADDRATPTFKQLSKTLDDLNGKFRDQAKAAVSGQGSVEDLTATLREYDQIGKDLVSQQAAIKAFNTLAKAGDDVAERVDRANKALEDYVLKQAAAGKDPSVNRYESLSRTIDTANKRQIEYNATLGVARDRLMAVGSSVETAAEDFAAINAAAGRTVVGIGQVTKATQTLEAAQGEIAVQAADQVKLEQQRAAAIKVTTALLQQRIAEEERATVASAKQSEGTDSLRKLGDDAVAAASNLNRFAQTGEVTVAGVTRLADAVRQIVAPTLATVQTLDGALEQVDASAAIAADGQKKRVSEYQDSLNALTQAQAAFTRQASNIDAYTKQAAAVDKLDAELGQAAQRHRELGAAAAAAVAPDEALTKSLAQSAKELENAGSAAKEGRTQLSELSDTLKRSGIDSNNLTSEIERLQTGAARSAPVVEQLTAKVGGNGKGFLGLKPYELQNLSYQVNDVFTSLASGISPTQTLAQQGGQIAQIFPGAISALVRFLPLIGLAAAGIGLVAYNFAQAKKESDAIRSFTTEFALFGNSVQYSAQQFAEAQIALERVGVSADDARKALREFIDSGQNPAGLNDFLTVVRGIAAATGEDVPTAAKQFSDALTKGYDSVASLNDITHTLTDAQLDQVKGLYDAGKAQEARTLVDEIYRQKAQGIADSSRGDWAIATQNLSQSFRDLNQSLGLVQGSVKLVSGLVGGLTAAMDALSGKAGIAAGALRVVFQTAAGGPGGGITQLLSEFGVGGFQAPKVAPVKPNLVVPTNPLASIKSVGADFGTGSTTAVNRRTAAQQKFLDQQQTELRNAKLLTAQRRLADAEREAGDKAAEAGFNQQDIAQARLNARKIEQQKIDKENETAGNKASAAANKAAREREAAARKAQERLNAIAELSKQVEAIDTSFAAKQNKQDDPFATIRAAATKAVADIQDKFRKLKLLGVTTVDGRTQQSFVDQINAGAAIQVQQAQLKKNEEDLNALLDQRKQKLAAIEDQLNAGLVTPAQALVQQKAVFDEFNPQIAKLATDGEAFAKSIRTAKFNPQLEASITKFETAGSKATSGADFLTAAQGDLTKSKANLDALVAQRNATVQLNEALAKVGLESGPQAQKKIAEAFTTTRPLIEAAADEVTHLIDQLLAIPGIPPATIASLQAMKATVLDTRASTQALTGDQLVLRNAAYQALSKGVGDFVTAIGDNIAAAIDGTKSLGGALEGIAQSALSFAASFTKAIAQAIIQLLALKAAKAILGAVGISTIGLHEGGIVGQDATFTRRISPLAMLGAVRYHSGGIAGIRPDEVPAILQKGEEVITSSDPRHRDNGGLSGGGAAPVVNVKNVNLFDAGEAVSQGANTGPGEKAILNVLSRNPSFLRGLVGAN